jgi:dTMP kinase
VFVSVEGIEGSGKTTLVAELADRLRQEEWAVELLRDFARSSFRSPVNEALRETRFFSLGFEDGPRAAFLYMLYHEAAKWDQANSTARDLMIADRFLDSIVAYQGLFLPVFEPEKVESLGRATSMLLQQIGVPIPDRTYLLDVPMELAAERFTRREGRDMSNFEMTRIAEIRRSLLALAVENPRFLVIDASRSLIDVVRTVLDDLNTLGQPARRA